MQRTLALLLAAALLLAVPAATAETVVVQAGWEKLGLCWAQGDYRPKIRVELQSSERLKGKLIEATGTGLRLVRHETETSIAREEIRTIGSDPQDDPLQERLLGLLIGIPAGFGAGFFFGAVASGGDIDRWGRASDTAFIATLIAVPYWFYKLGARADRRTVLIVWTRARRILHGTARKRNGSLRPRRNDLEDPRRRSFHEDHGHRACAPVASIHPAVLRGEAHARLVQSASCTPKNKDRCASVQGRSSPGKPEDQGPFRLGGGGLHHAKTQGRANTHLGETGRAQGAHPPTILETKARVDRPGGCLRSDANPA